jgi:nitronate monooxygenase
MSSLQALFGTALPIIQAPMAGANLSAMAIAVSEAGGLGSLPCAMLSPDQVRREVQTIRTATAKPFNLNFFCHTPPVPDRQREAAWLDRLRPYYREFGLDANAPAGGPTRGAFDEALCAVVEELRPPVVSFHFGLPPEPLLRRVKETGAKILSSATTVAEAAFLAEWCDAIIAQGLEAGGHRGMFLTADLDTQLGTLALVPAIVDAVTVPVIAAGGLADARGIAAALTLGAAAVQLGTAYLGCPESTISDLHRAALTGSAPTAITNVITGRPSRGIVNRLVREVGPISPLAPSFPNALPAILPLRAAAEARGSADFSPLWAGQAYPLSRALPAGALTRQLMTESLSILGGRRPAE